MIGRALAASAGLALAASLMLVGCTPAPLSGGTDGTNDQQGGPSTSSAPDVGAGQATEGALPDGFPSDFPLIEGDVLIGFDLGTGWSVWIASDDPAADFVQAVALLTAGGYTEVSSLTNEQGSFGIYAKGDQQVQVSAGIDSAYGEAVSYTIFTAPPSPEEAP